MQVVSAQRSSGWTQQPKFDRQGRPRCFQCNAYGHFAVECHSKPAVAKPKTEVDWVGALTQQQELKLVESTIDRRATVCGSIGGHSFKNILLDTGATQTVIKRELVDPHYFTGEHKVARSFNGNQQSFPLAKTSVRVDGAEHDLDVLVADELCYDALLGRDVPELWEIGKRLLYDDLIGIVQTRSNKKSHFKNSHPNTESPEISSLTTQTIVRRVKMKTVHSLQMEEPSMSCLMSTTTRVMTVMSLKMLLIPQTLHRQQEKNVT